MTIHVCLSFSPQEVTRPDCTGAHNFRLAELSKPHSGTSQLKVCEEWDIFPPNFIRRRSERLTTAHNSKKEGGGRVSSALATV